MMQLPQTLPMNIIDRQFLVPETADFVHGDYLPMTTSAVVRPRVTPSVEALQDALIILDEKSPEYRLSYTLNLEKSRWERISEGNRIAYLKGCVQKVEATSIDDHISIHLQKNFSPLEHPFKVFLVEDAICVHLYHPMGDAIYLLQLTASLLTALYKPHLLDEVNHQTVIPLRKVVLGSFPQTARVLGHTFKRMNVKARNFISGFFVPAAENGSVEKNVFRPTVNGTEMRVAHIEISPEKMKHIRSVVKQLPADQKITLNTFLQVFFAFRMNEMGLVDWPVELATLVSLRRYMTNPDSFYPGNCINNIRLAMHKDSFVGACVKYQNQLMKLIDSAYPLSDVVGNWILSLGGDRTVKRAVRHWYLNSSQMEGRFYTFTNAGRVDDFYAPVREEIFPDIRVFTPIMGSAPLVIAFISMDNHGHFTATYKPDILSLEDIQKILNFDNLATTIEKFGNDAQV